MIYNADARNLPLPDESVDMCVTSPPYWGLRDYGVTGQLGLEPTPEEYIENMVTVFREVKRVLKAHGTLWLNIGDSYAGSGKGWGAGSISENTNHYERTGESAIRGVVPDGLKPKDLVGIPWMLAFALRADGWYLRSDIIWHKPNPMPESVRDRPTKAHEYIFLLSKSKKYYYDADAIREIGQMKAGDSAGSAQRDTQITHGLGGGNSGINAAKQKLKLELAEKGHTTRNKRSVWTVTTKPYSGAHFATYPPDLIEPCIKAGSSEKGVCPECGKAWERVAEKPKPPKEVYAKNGKPDDIAAVSHPEIGNAGMGQKLQDWYNKNPAQTVGWQPTCDHDAEPVKATVLDPFMGSGTTLLVARQLGRKGIGVELNPEYIELAKKRLEMDPGLGEGPKVVEDNWQDTPLFSEVKP